MAMMCCVHQYEAAAGATAASGQHVTAVADCDVIWPAPAAAVAAFDHARGFLYVAYASYVANCGCLALQGEAAEWELD